MDNYTMGSNDLTPEQKKYALIAIVILIIFALWAFWPSSTGTSSLSNPSSYPHLTSAANVGGYNFGTGWGTSAFKAGKARLTANQKKLQSVLGM